MTMFTTPPFPHSSSPNMSSDKRRSTETEEADDGFITVHKRKQRKMERQRPKFQYNTAHFGQGRKVGIAVSSPSRRKDLANAQHIRDLSMYIAAEGPQKPQWMVVEVGCAFGPLRL